MQKLATMFGVGLVKKAPGTAGSFVAALIAAAILQLPHGWTLLAAGTIFFCLAGTVAADAYMRAHATDHDPSEIVIDELAGQWVTYIVWYLWIAGITSRDVSADMLQVDASPMYLVLGFVLFRFFDILKPWPINWADRHIKGGFGVMFDDLLAGFAAGSVLYLFYLFWPMVTGQMEQMP